MDKLDFESALRMKYLVESKVSHWGWRICNNGYPFEIFLDDGDSSYFHFQFSEEKYDAYEVEEIAKGLASFLNIDCRFYLPTDKEYQQE